MRWKVGGNISKAAALASGVFVLLAAAAAAGGCGASDAGDASDPTDRDGTGEGPGGEPGGAGGSDGPGGGEGSKPGTPGVDDGGGPGPGPGDGGAGDATSTLVCTAPTADCNLDATDGCEANLLTSVKNCGRCGNDCGSAACASGRCKPQTLVASINRPAQLVADGTNVYWLSSASSPFSNDGSLGKVPRRGGTSTKLVDAMYLDLFLTLYNDALYYCDATASGGATRRIRRLSTAAGAKPTTFARGVTCTGASRNLLVNAQGAFYSLDAWANLPDGGFGPRGVLYKFVSGATSEVELATNVAGPQGLALNGTDLYYEVQGTIDDTGKGAVRHISTNGGKTAAVQTGLHVPEEVLFGGDGYLYFDVWDVTKPGTAPGTISRRRADGSGTLEVLAKNQPEPYGLALDATYAYWAVTNDTDDSTAIRRVPRAGGAVDELYSVTGRSIVFLAVDDEAVYFTYNEPTGSSPLFRIAK